MNRSDFLTMIPSLAALPFLSKEIVKEEKRIILIEPKPIEVVKEMPCDMDFGQEKLQFLMVYDGKVIGSAGRMNVGMSNGYVSDMSLQINSDYMVRSRLEVTCSFDNDKVVEAFCNSRKC